MGAGVSDMPYEMTSAEMNEYVSALRAHDAEQRRQVEELTRERDAAEERAAEQRQRAERAEAQRDELRIVIAADDERLHAAEERVWPGKTWGCDAPEMLADEILALRARIAEMATRRPTEYELSFLNVLGSDSAWEFVQDRLLKTAQGNGEEGRGEGSTGGRASHSTHAATEASADPRAPSLAPTLSLSEAREQALLVGREVDRRLAGDQQRDATEWQDVAEVGPVSTDAEPTPPAETDQEMSDRVEMEVAIDLPGPLPRAVHCDPKLEKCVRFAGHEGPCSPRRHARIMPPPTPPAAEASEVEALARELLNTTEESWPEAKSVAVWKSLHETARGAYLVLARHVLRREAALRERAERAEAEVERLRAKEKPDGE